jgi:hypothetical protein
MQLHLFESRLKSLPLICRSLLVLLIATLPATCLHAQNDSLPTVDSLGGADQVDLPAISVTVADTDNDAGGALTLGWDDPGYSELPDFYGYEISRRPLRSNELVVLDTVLFGVSSVIDKSVSDDTAYVYTITALIGTNRYPSTESTAASSSWQAYNSDLTPLLVIAILVCGSVIIFIESARRGRKLFLRKIAGLEAVDEAVGRATEMGRPILFVAGINDMDDVQTIAGLTILGKIGRTIAEYDTRITMPTRTSLVMTAGRETLRASYMSAGRPDAYSDEMVFYVTDEQFGFAAAVDGILVRDKPATCFYLGTFHAESLIMAETGNSIGAIQIAGTAQPAQLPFFVAACDYTLIGEELFAASAYLSEEPRQLGSLKGQDVGKAAAILLIIFGALSTTAAAMSDAAWVQQFNQFMLNLITLG